MSFLLPLHPLQRFRPSPALLRRFASSQSEALQAAKSAAALSAVESIRKDQLVIGVGSGSTVACIVEELRKDRMRHVDRTFIPTSYQSHQLILSAGLRLGDLDQFPVLDLTLDGADDIDANLNAIKGGGACHLREKVVAEKSSEFVLVADWTKQSEVLGSGNWTSGIPLEVVPFGASLVSEAITELPGFEKMELRMAPGGKAGPVVTDNGNFVIDAHFAPDIMATPRSLLLRLKILTGVVEVGLFVGLAREAIIGLEDGTVKRITL